MKSHSKSSLFLLEIMLTLLIFLICAVVCVLIFAKASVTVTHSKDLNNAAVLAQNAVEIVKSEQSAYGYNKFYDENLNEAPEQNSVYKARLTVGESDGTITYFAVEVLKKDTDESLYSISSAFLDTEVAASA